MSIRGSLENRVESLEQQLAAALKALAAPRREAIPAVAQQVRLARTTNDGGSYPTAPADTFAIKFLDGTFTENDGDQTPTYTARQAAYREYAHNIAGAFIPEDTVVVVSKFNGKWWIIHTVGLRQKFLNESGETAPPWAVMRVTGVSVVAGEAILTIAKADTNWAAPYVFNEGAAVAYNATGYIQNLPVLKAKVNATEAVRDRLNPVSGQWYLAEDRSLPAVLTCHGMVVSTGDDKHCLGHWVVGPKARIISFTLAEALATTDTEVDVTVTDYHDGSNPCITGTSLTVSNGLEFEGEIGAKGVAEHCPEADVYRIYQMVCPPPPE